MSISPCSDDAEPGANSEILAFSQFDSSVLSAPPHQIRSQQAFLSRKRFGGAFCVPPTRPPMTRGMTPSNSPGSEADLSASPLRHPLCAQERNSPVYFAALTLERGRGHRQIWRGYGRAAYLEHAIGELLEATGGMPLLNRFGLTASLATE